jgi:uncharacterized membrane protein
MQRVPLTKTRIIVKTSLVLASAIASVVAMPLIAAPAPTPSFSAEKCYGIAAKGANDCGSATHSCAGNATKAKDGSSWVYVPSGTCKKIEGGSLAAK